MFRRTFADMGSEILQCACVFLMGQVLGVYLLFKGEKYLVHHFLVIKRRTPFNDVIVSEGNKGWSRETKDESEGFNHRPDKKVVDLYKITLDC